MNRVTHFELYTPDPEAVQPFYRDVFGWKFEKFEGGPVGVGTLSAAIQEERDSIEEIIEPYLIQIGFLNRTPRGRMATPLAYQHFGTRTGQQPPSLF